jgi:hypothetical protein
MAAAFSMPQRGNYKPARVPSIEEHHKRPSSFDGVLPAPELAEQEAPS